MVGSNNLQGDMEYWHLHPTPKRREIADHILNRCLEDPDCTNADSGAANTVTAFCLALAEVICANSLPCNWHRLNDVVVHARIREEINRIAELTRDDRFADTTRR